MNAVARHGVSIALSCRTFEISEKCYRYSPVLSDENEEIGDWLERLTANKRMARAFCICATCRAIAGTTNASIPLADRRLQSNLPRGGSTANWS
jgi:hypothetical protein